MQHYRNNCLLFFYLFNIFIFNELIKICIKSYTCNHSIINIQKEQKEKYKNKIEVYAGVEEDSYCYVNRNDFDYILGSSHYLVKDNQYMPIGMCIGLAIGVGIGAALGNIPLYMCIGLSIGVGIGALIDSKNKEKS